MNIDNGKYTTGERIITLARSTESVSLGLLRAIDETVDALGAVSNSLSALSDMCLSIQRDASECDIVTGVYLDEDDIAIASLERTENTAKDYLSLMVRKRSSIDKDPNLLTHHCEALHDAYEQFEVTVVGLIEAAQQARAAIITHDLSAEPRDCDAFNSAEELITSLRA